MKLGRVRMGERFVFDHIGGVYTKVSSSIARCIYGPKFGQEEPINKDMSVYVIFEDRDKFKKKIEPDKADTTIITKTEIKPNPELPQVGMKMVLINDDDKVIAEIPNATAMQIAAYSHAEAVKLNSKDIGRSIRETLIDHTTQTLYVVLGD